MRDHASELSPIAFDFDEGAASFVLFGALREYFLEQTAEPVLLALNPEDKDTTEVGRKVGLSYNSVNRPTDKPGPRNRKVASVP